MKTIWKVELTQGIGYKVVKVPEDSKLLHVGFQGIELCAWFQVNTANDISSRELFVAGTGHEIPDTVVWHWRHVGTAVSSVVRYVWHVYVKEIL